MPILNYLWIIPALPLLGSAINGLFGAKWPNKLVNTVAVGSTGLSFLAALEAVREFTRLAPENIPWVQQYFTWIIAGDFRAGFDLQIDQLTVVMLLVVTGVGWLIHIYSTGYMAHESGYYRFFSYLNLFMFFMLILVLAANYVLLFVGWEGVGLCSYLLIGFYFLRKSAADAGKKAFIVNRIGDFGFMLGMFLLFKSFGTLDFVPLFAKAAPLPPDALGHLGMFTVACLLLFMGACGKSAQLPLYVWLPDAMEGPTPESADSAGQKHVAKLADGGVSENFLDVGLDQCDGGREECGGAADGGDDDQRGFRVFEQDVRAGDDVDTGSNHGGRVDQGAYGRRPFHGVGQPDVKRELRGFTAGSHEEQQARDGERTENAPAFTRKICIVHCCEQRVEVECLEGAEEQEHAEHEAEVADTVDDESFFASVGGGFSEEIKADEQVAR